MVRVIINMKYLFSVPTSRVLREFSASSSRVAGVLSFPSSTSPYLSSRYTARDEPRLTNTDPGIYRSEYRYSLLASARRWRSITRCVPIRSRDARGVLNQAKLGFYSGRNPCCFHDSSGQTFDFFFRALIFHFLYRE